MGLIVTSDSKPQLFGDPDSNKNGKLATFDSSRAPYEMGQAIDAIVATGTPTAIVPTGPMKGLRYLDVVQDMVDWYAFCQYDDTS